MRQRWTIYNRGTMERYRAFIIFYAWGSMASAWPAFCLAFESCGD